MSITDVARRVVGLDPRAAPLDRIEHIERDDAAEAAEEQRKIAAAQAAADALEATRLAPGKLRDAAAARSMTVGNKIAAEETILLENEPRAKRALSDRVGRVIDKLAGGPRVEYRAATGGGPDVIVNAVEIQRHAAALDLACHIRAELRQRALFRMRTDELIARVEEIAHALDDAVLGTPAERA